MELHREGSEPAACAAGLFATCFILHFMGPDQPQDVAGARATEHRSGFRGFQILKLTEGFPLPGC